MKKLMIVAAVAMVAIGASASAVEWGSGTMYFDGVAGSPASGTSKLNASKNVGTGYLLYLANEAAYTTIAAKLVSDGVYSAEGAKAVYADFQNDVYGDHTKATTATSNKSAIIKLDDGGDYTGMKYALLIFEAGTGDNKFFIANVASVDVGPTKALPLDSALKVGGESGTIATSWTAASVPEPTSAMLMLLGMAGLALRRRRA